MGKWENRETFLQFGKALLRLEEALLRSADQDDLVIDATIQRFEFTFELCWKSMKKFLIEEGLDATTPRQVLQYAYGNKWIHNEALWLGMLQDRNLTSHTYREEQARQIYTRIHKYAPELRNLFQFLSGV